MSDGRPLELVTSGIPDPPLRRDRLTGAESAARYAWAAGAVEGREVLDAGCGDGAGSRALADAGAARVTGIDVAPPPRSEETGASADGSDAGISFQAGDVQAMRFDDGSFDVAVCLDVIQDVADPGRCLDELRRVLRPGGIAFVSSPAPGGEPALARTLDEARLKADLGERFVNVRVVGQRTAMASAVGLDDDAGAGTVHLAGAPHAGAGAGPVRHLIAIASDAELPSLPAAASLDSGGDIHDAAETAAAWEERARREAAEAGADRFELNHARKSLEIAQRRLEALGSGGLLGRLRRRG